MSRLPGASNFQKSRTLNDTYLLGDEIGKGAYGRVHKGLDLQNGDFVAIKQVSLENIPQEDLSSIMSEIDLLKNLNHKNIVKYLGSFKTKSDLYIILEFVENGSLASIVKPNKFGAFPESLVAIYIAQVLEGLVYLHEQGVIHRDIKGANILTTKEGTVKLADFGVATKLNEADGNALSVVGTPYWMAPEVIEMSGVTASADIWSVGCTVIELMTCVPPYYDLQPMPALFRIVQDDQPPIPDNLSPTLTDFLRQCFRKDAKLRPGAAALLHHPWILNSRRSFQTLQKRGSALPDVSTVVDRTLEDGQPEEGRAESRFSGASGWARPLSRTTSEAAEQSGTLERRHPLRSEGSAGSRGSMGDGLLQHSSFPRSLSDSLTSGRPSQSRGRSTSDSPPVSIRRHGASSLGANQLAEHLIDAGHQGSGPVTTPAGAVAAQLSEPLHGAAAPGTIAAVSRTPVSIASRGESRGYSDGSLASREGEEQLGAGLRREDSGMAAAAQDTLQGQLRKGLIGDLWRYSDTERDKQVADLFEIPGRMEEPLGSRNGGRSKPSLPARLRTKLAQRQEVSAASKHREQDLLGHLSDPTDGGSTNFDALDGALLGRDISALQSTEMARLLAELRPQRSEEQILGACRLFVQLAKEFPQHKAQVLAEQSVIPLLEMLDGDNPKILLAVLTVLNELMRNNVTFQENLCMVGLIPTVLAFASAERSRPEIRIQAAIFVHQMCHGSTLTLQMLIACRGLPVLVGFLEPDISKHRELVYMAMDTVWRVLELQSPTPRNDFCRLFAKSGLLLRLVNTMHGLCSLGGGVADLRDRDREREGEVGGVPFGSRGRQQPDPAVGADLDFAGTSSSADEGRDSGPAGAVPVRTNASTPGRRLVRSRSGNLDFSANSPGPSASLSPLQGRAADGRSGEGRLAWSGGSSGGGIPDREESDAVCLGKAAGLLLEMSRGGEVVKAQFCSQSLLKRLLDMLDKLDRPILIKVLQCVKNLAMDPNCLEPLQRADAIKKLVPFLELRDGPLVREIHTQVLSALYNLCKINKRRQELAAEAGVIPHLMHLITANSPLKQFGLPLLCDMAHASRTTREALRQHGGLELYLALLQDDFWAPTALDSLAVCLAHDNERRQVEQVLLRRDSLERLVAFFKSCRGPSFVQILEPFLKMMTKSVRLNAALAVSGLTPLLVMRLDHQDPIARLNLLKMIKAVYEHHPRPKQLIAEHDLPRKLQRLTEERRDGERSGGQVLVKQMASVLLKGLHVNTVL